MSYSPVADEQRNQGDVPAAVRALLLSTKQLQKSLTQWSVGQVSETQVSDVYVQIGTDFNNTIQAFAYHRIDLRCVALPQSCAIADASSHSDIHSVPKDLRTVLEQCLAEDPSPEVLAMFMPDVKQVLVKLLRGLRSRQEAWRTRGGAPYDFR
jgi:hypothetical protein